MTDAPEYLRARDIARLTGVSLRTARRWIAAIARAELAVLKDMLSRIRPAVHGVSAKSYSNLRSLFAAALQLAGVIDPSGRGIAKRHQAWGSLLEAIADNQRLS